MYYNSTGEDNGPPWTTYFVRAPDDTPNDPTNNPVVCSMNFPGYNADLVTALRAATPQAGAPALFVAYFRQWYRICTVETPETGTYFLQIETATKADGTPAPQGSGANRFAVAPDSTTTSRRRACGSSARHASASTPMRRQRTRPSSSPACSPGAKGRNLVINFFDTGDAAAAGTLTVLPPPDSNVGASFSGCTYTSPPGTSTGPPWGTFTDTASGCRITNVSSTTYNAEWIQLKVPIPDDYDCTYDVPNGCWARINFAFPSNVQDTTAWTARIEGDPVRLIE